MIVGIADPLKQGVPAAVQTLRKAGVTTRMVTGDNLQTARAIARNAGILEADWDKATGEYDNENMRERENKLKYTCMEGPEFMKLTGGLIEVKNDDGGTRKVIKNTQKFRQIAKYLRVMANSSPLDK